MKKNRYRDILVATLIGTILGFGLGLRFDRLTLVRVIDGDTVVARNWRDGLEWRVRFMGIDAPDRKECYGEVSKSLLERYLSEGRVRFERFGYDGYGRILAKVYAGDQDLQERLVATGAVRVYDAKNVHDDIKPETSYVEELRKLEEEARSKKLGIWSDTCFGL